VNVMERARLGSGARMREMRPTWLGWGMRPLMKGLFAVGRARVLISCTLSEAEMMFGVAVSEHLEINHPTTMGQDEADRFGI
jgi:hypothetical protein